MSSALPGSRARARALSLALALAALSAAGCKSDPPTPPAGVTFAGSFRLDAVGGTGLPYNYHCFGASCATLLSGRVEVMSNGRVRDIVTYRPGPASAPIVDTVISAYTLQGTRVILDRSPSGGSLSTYKDSGEVDTSGRLLLKPGRIQTYQNSQTFLYSPE